MDKIAGVLLIGVFVFGFLYYKLNRYSIEAGSGTEGTAVSVYFKLDRWTGDVEWCVAQNDICLHEL